MSKIKKLQEKLDELKKNIEERLRMLEVRSQENQIEARAHLSVETNFPALWITKKAEIKIDYLTNQGILRNYTDTFRTRDNCTEVIAKRSGKNWVEIHAREYTGEGVTYTERLMYAYKIDKELGNVCKVDGETYESVKGKK